MLNYNPKSESKFHERQPEIELAQKNVPILPNKEPTPFPIINRKGYKDVFLSYRNLYKEIISGKKYLANPDNYLTWSRREKPFYLREVAT